MATITLPENGTITVTTKLGIERLIPVKNIDKVLEPASIIFIDNMGYVLNGTETVLEEEVTAMVQCDESIQAVEGELRYVFKKGSNQGDSYTFRYQDAAGNEGTIDAVLPCNITPEEKDENYVDLTAPGFNIFLYGMRNNKYQLITEIMDPDDYYVEEGTITNDQFVNLISGTDGVLASYAAQEYKFVMKITDESATKLVVQETGTPAPESYEAAQAGSAVSYVTVNNNTILIPDNLPEGKTFDIYMIDENNNVRSITGIDISTIDKAAPVYKVTYVLSEDKKSVQAIFEPAEGENPEELIYPLDKTMETVEVPTGEYDEYNYPVTVSRYFYNFTDNGEKTFTYKDICGNTGSVLASVQGISTAAARVTSVVWSGTADGNEPASDSAKVNKDINAKLNLSKAVSAVNFYQYDAEAEHKKGEPLPETTAVTMNFTAKNVFITYGANMGKIVVELIASESGNITYYILPAVECIDKEKPQVQVTKTEIAENKRSATVSFEINEEVVMAEDVKTSGNAQKVTFATNYTWTARDNKEKVLHFTDKAGNIAEYKVTENSVVDMETLTAVYSATEDHLDETANPANDFKLEAGDEIWIKTNKAAEVAMGDTLKTSVSADTWTKLELPEVEGIYMLKLTDSNTKEVYSKTLSVQLKDSVAPDILLDGKTIVLKEAADVSEMLQKIRSGVSIYDNKDGDITTYDVTGYPQTIVPGLYELTYTASDKAGNVASTSRTLYIMEEGMTVLYVNGVPALPYARTVLDKRELKFELDGFGDPSLLTMKIRSDLKSVGQMKRYATTIEDMKTTVAEDGFYTVYIRTQDRSEYVTYLYVEE